jgi:DNA repair protein RadC
VPEEIAEKAGRLGVGALSPSELLAFGFSSRIEDVRSAEEHAKRMLRSSGKLRAIASLDAGVFAAEAGLSQFEALRVQALIELGRRLGSAGKGASVSIDGPEDVFSYFSHLREEKTERFCALLLDSKNVVLRDKVVHIGTVNASIVGVREFYREAVREAAASVIAVHNHPSGDPSPSPEDFEVTRVLADAGRLLDIPLLDHVIVGESEFRSMQRLGAIA